MQGQLATPKLKWKPYAMVALVAIIIGSTLYFLNKDKENTSIAKNETINTTSNTVPLENTNAPSNTTPKLKEDNATTQPTINGATKTPNVLTTKNEPLKRPTALANSTINKQANFYIDLTKEPEVFTIDPTKENMVNCKQGSTLTIPANSVIDSDGKNIVDPISITVQEYYRYDGEATTNNASAAMIKYELYKGEERVAVLPSQAVIIKMSNGLQNFKVLNNEDVLSDKAIQQMTWVSNEKFYADTRKKIDYKITLDNKFNANTFMSEIAFPKEKVIMAGNIENNSIIFSNVPIGETAYFMSIGKINNKYFSCSKKLVTGNTNITVLDFVEISETLYKKQLDELGKLGQ
jgi:hypothetical protein